ncbi:MAG: nuclear transport factor 2 family protein [Pseudonocardiaceae bacterium]
MTVAQHQEDLNRALFEALVADGFTSCCCGPKGDPTAVIVFYEWPDHLDMITVARTGPAAAARLVKPAGVGALDGDPNPLILNPPRTAMWAWVGPADMAIWALLDLPHPESPDVPVGEVPTPDALCVPHARPMHIRVPTEGKKGARAARLSQPGPPKIMGEQFFNDLLDEVDSNNAIGFASHFTEDGVFTWGNFQPRVGRPEIAEFTQGFFAAIHCVRHRLDTYWLVADQCAMTTGEVTFTPLSGTEVTVPFATVSHFTADGLKMTSYRVYLDPSPLVGVTQPPQ